MIGRCRHKKGDVSIFLSHLLLLDIPNNRADEVGGAHVLLVFGFVEFFGPSIVHQIFDTKKEQILSAEHHFVFHPHHAPPGRLEVIQGTRGTLIESYVGIKYF